MSHSLLVIQTNRNRGKFCPTCFPDCISSHCTTMALRKHFKGLLSMYTKHFWRYRCHFVKFGRVLLLKLIATNFKKRQWHKLTQIPYGKRLHEMFFTDSHFLGHNVPTNLSGFENSGFILSLSLIILYRNHNTLNFEIRMCLDCTFIVRIKIYNNFTSSSFVSTYSILRFAFFNDFVKSPWTSVTAAREFVASFAIPVAVVADEL